MWVSLRAIRAGWPLAERRPILDVAILSSHQVEEEPGQVKAAQCESGSDELSLSGVKVCQTTSSPSSCWSGFLIRDRALKRFCPLWMRLRRGFPIKAISGFVYGFCLTGHCHEFAVPSAEYVRLSLDLLARVSQSLADTVFALSPLENGAA